MVERYNTRSLLHLAKLSHEHDWGTGHLKVYYEDGWALWEQWDAANADAHDHRPETVTYGAHLREDLHLWTNGTLTLGLDQDYAGGEASDTYHTQTASSYTFDRVTFRNTAPYLLVSHTFGDQVKVTPSAGVRYNFSRHFDDEWGAQAGLRVAFGDTELYANAARAFNYPGVYTAVFSRSFWAFKPVATLDDWEGLDAETVEHIEAGVVHRFLPWLSAELSAYRDEVEDAVRIAAPPAYPPPPRFAPIGSYTVEGVEASLRASPWSCLDVYVGVNAMHTDPGDVPDAPDWSASAGITWRPYHRLTLNLDAEFVGERCVVNTRVAGTAQEEVGRHLLLDARGAFRLTPAGSRVQAEVFAVVENLTDEEYEYQPDYPMPGATFTAGLDVRF